MRPLYEGDGDHTRLLRVLDIEAEYAESVDAKLAVFAQAVSVAEGPLADPSRAFAYASRALREAAAEPELTKWLGTVPRGLVQNADAKALGLEQATDEGHAERGVIDVRVTGHQHHVASIPTERIHLGARAR